MGEPSVTRRVTIVNTQGLHARPADLFVRVANRFAARIEVTNGRECVDGKSILGILTLAAEQGTQLVLGATGHDAHDALDALARLVEQGFVTDEAEHATEGAG
jgi:phosphotransferase system HPr (HPr) family protein